MSALPFHVKIPLILVSLISFFFILYISGDILVPLLFACIIAVLLDPIVNFFCRKGLNRMVAISISLGIVLLILCCTFILIGAQIGLFWNALPTLIYKFNVLTDQIINWTSYNFGISSSLLEDWLNKKKMEGINGPGNNMGQTIMGISSVVVLIFLVPVYVFLFLYYKPLILEFIARQAGEKQENAVGDILRSTRAMVHHYLIGLLFELIIVAVLNSVALLLIGVDYAIVLGIIAAILNLVPYIGGVVGVALPMVIALLSGTGMSAIFVLASFTLIQLIDNNFIVPLVVASKVRINALASIVVVIIGGALWGVGGMFLAIPLTAFVKVLCDKIPSLNAFGLLIGDEIPTTTPFKR